MIHENIKTLRKKKGYSQETLAAELHVVRQTISKWEKGLSVPDAEQLQRLAEVLDVSVEEILGSKLEDNEERDRLEEITYQLSILNDQYARVIAQKRKTRTIAFTVIGTALILILVFMVYFTTHAYTRGHGNEIAHHTDVHCTLGEEDYYFGFDTNDADGIVKGGGNEYIMSELDVEHHHYSGHELEQKIEKHFTHKGGTCDISRN